MRFDGKDDHIYFDKLAKEMIDKQKSLSFAFWVKSSGKGGTSMIFDAGFYANNSISMLIGENVGSTLPVSGKGHHAFGGPIGTYWRHVALVWDGKKQFVYSDGEVRGSLGLENWTMTFRHVGRWDARIGGQVKRTAQSHAAARARSSENSMITSSLRPPTLSRSQSGCQKLLSASSTSSMSETRTSLIFEKSPSRASISLPGHVSAAAIARSRLM